MSLNREITKTKTRLTRHFRDMKSIKTVLGHQELATIALGNAFIRTYIHTSVNTCNSVRFRKVPVVRENCIQIIEEIAREVINVHGFNDF